MSGPRGAALLAAKLLAFLRRDYLEASTYRFSFLSSLAGIFFSSATFYFVSRLVPPGTPSLEAFGGDFFAFAVVGIAFSSLLGIFQEGLPSVIRGAQVSGTLEALLVTRTSIPTVLVGSSLYSLIFQALRTGLHIGLAVAVFGLELGRVNGPGLISVLALTSLCFLSIGVLSASFILVYKAGNPFGWIFGSVSGLLGGVVFPVSLLPDWIRWVSALLPVTHALNGVRKSLLASATFADILPSIAALAVFNAVLLPVSLVAFRLAVRKAKKDGTLTHY